MRTPLIGSLFLLSTSTSLVLAEGPPAAPPPTVVPPQVVWSPGDGGAPAWTAAEDSESKSRVWGGADYLLWWVKDGSLPYPFVLTGPVNGPAPNNNPGALNEGGVPVLTGRSVDYGTRSGVRLTLGGWLDSEGSLGIEGSGFFLPQHAKVYQAASDGNGNPVLGFRYMDTPFANNLAEDIFQASIPPGNANGVGPFAGGLAVISSTQVWGAELNGVAAVSNSGPLRLQALAGYRYVDLSESLTLQSQTTALGGSSVMFQGTAFPAPASTAVIDSFRTRNEFSGGQIGVRGEYTLGNLIVSGTAKIALGNNHETLEVQGVSTLFPNPGAPVSVPVGEFAGPSNIGHRTKDEFAVVPEVELKVGYQVTSWLRATVGYDFMDISRVVRPGDQLDLVINNSVNPTNAGFGVTPIDHSTFPRPFFNQTNFWAQGVTFGLELQY